MDGDGPFVVSVIIDKVFFPPGIGIAGGDIGDDGSGGHGTFFKGEKIGKWFQRRAGGSGDACGIDLAPAGTIIAVMKMR